MAILQECTACHKKQSVRNRKCSCGNDLMKARRAQRAQYFIDYRMPDGRQKRESVGYSYDEARAAEGKRLSQKKEGRIFDMLPESKMTMKQLSAWYLGLGSVQKLATYSRIGVCLNNFNKAYGDYKVSDIKRTDLENYQEKRSEDGCSPATIDMELTVTKTIITKAFDDDLLDGHALKAFRAVKKKLKKGSNARKRTLTIEEYLKLIDTAHAHLKPILIMLFNTGARLGEIRTLQWSFIDRKAGMIRLPEAATKERKEKNIPINHHVAEVLDNTPRHIDHDFVITYRGKPITEPGGFNHSFRTTCKEAGVPYGRKLTDGITLHDFRRTVKTNMLNAGVDKAHRDVILGHTLEGMDGYYLSPTEGDLIQAMEKYTNWFDDQVKKTGAGFGQQKVNNCKK